MAALALHHASTTPDALVLVVSPSARQSGEFLRKVESFAARLRLPQRADGRNEMSLALPNGSRIVALPGRDDTTRGFSSVSLLLIDEAAYVPDPLYPLRPRHARRLQRPPLAHVHPQRPARLLLENLDRSRSPLAQNRRHRRRLPPHLQRLPRRNASPPRHRVFSQEYECQFVAPEGAFFETHWLEGMFTDETPAWK